VDAKVLPKKHTMMITGNSGLSNPAVARKKVIDDNYFYTGGKNS
jgi:hypothetical protein